MFIIKRIPALAQVLPVYAVAVLMIYSWTILWFFWKLPSLIDFLNIDEILSAFAYILAVNFLESLLVICVPLLLTLILPRKWFYDLFIVRGAALVISFLGFVILLAFQFQTINGYPDLLLNVWSIALTVLIIIFIVYMAGRVTILQKVLGVLADRATIFLYLTIPLSLIAGIVIFFRLMA